MPPKNGSNGTVTKTTSQLKKPSANSLTDAAISKRLADVKGTNSQTSLVGGREIVYPKYSVRIHCIGYEGPITGDIAKTLLDWENETDYVERMLTENPGTKEGKWRFGDEFLFKLGMKGSEQKINCWNNCKNRPFDEAHCRKLSQDILTRNYEMNLENIIIGETGLVLSGQHRLIALCIAIYEWKACKLKNAKGHWEEYWEEEPFIESSIGYGAKETPKVLRTYDNVKPRTLADTVYTSPLFERMVPVDRKECSRMMDFAVDLLWKRTAQATEWSKYQTHSSSLEFLDKHPKIKTCVKHIFDNNRDRVVSRLGLSPGQSAGMMYLMGCSATEGESYHFPGSPKTEKQLDWEHWDKAMEFWSGLVDPKNETLEPVRKALSNLTDPHTGASAPEKLKQMVLSLAWNQYVVDNVPYAASDLDIGPYLKWSEAKERTLIVEEPTVSGIDNGVVKGGGESDEVNPSAEELEKAKAEERAKAEAKRLEQMERAVKKDVPKEDSDDDTDHGGAGPASGTGNKPFTDAERKALVDKMKPTAKATEAKVAPKKTPARPGLKK